MTPGHQQVDDSLGVEFLFEQYCQQSYSEWLCYQIGRKPEFDINLR